MITQIARLKGLIYISGDTGISIKQLSQLTKIPQSKVKQFLKQINYYYQTDVNSAFQLLNIHGTIQLVTKKALNHDIQEFLKDRHTSILTTAALETLTIIAYNQPITRIEIDNIRGVNSTVTIQKLLNQKLIKKQGKKRTVGNPFMYITTNAFLNLFGLKNLKQLPSIPHLKNKEAH